MNIKQNILRENKKNNLINQKRGLLENFAAQKANLE
jgi:hypothetical protein